MHQCVPSGTSLASVVAPEMESCITPAGCWSIGVWFQMADMLGAQCGAQHSQVDDNGNTQRHRCPYQETQCVKRLCLFVSLSMCVHMWAYCHACNTCWFTVNALLQCTGLCVCYVFTCVCVSALVLIHLHSSCTLAALMHTSLRTITPANGNEENIPKTETRGSMKTEQ